MSWKRRGVKPLRKSVAISICNFCISSTVCSKKCSLEFGAVLGGELSKRMLAIKLVFRLNAYSQLTLCAEILSLITSS